MAKYTTTPYSEATRCASVWRDGSEILQTSLMGEPPEKHDDVAKFTAKALEAYEASKSSGSSSGSSSGTVDLKWAKEVLTDAVKFNGLNSFEEEFSKDMLARIEQYGERARVSPKQLDVIKKIEEKIYTT